MSLNQLCESNPLRDPSEASFGPGQINTLMGREKLGYCYDLDLGELFRNGLSAHLSYYGPGKHFRSFYGPFEWVILHSMDIDIKCFTSTYRQQCIMAFNM